MTTFLQAAEAVATSEETRMGLWTLFTKGGWLMWPLLALGGKGVISVLSNVAPQYTHDICAKWFAGETAESLSMQLKAVPLIKALFADVNPIPVKWAMNRLGWNAGDCRLPLVAPSAAVQAQLETAMQEFGLLK